MTVTVLSVCFLCFQVFLVLLGILILLCLILQIQKLPTRQLNAPLSVALAVGAFILILNPVIDSVTVETPMGKFSFIKPIVDNNVRLASLLKEGLTPEQKKEFEPLYEKLSQTRDKVIKAKPQTGEAELLELMKALTEASSGTTEYLQRVLPKTVGDQQK